MRHCLSMQMGKDRKSINNTSFITSLILLWMTWIDYVSPEWQPRSPEHQSTLCIITSWCHRHFPQPTSPWFAFACKASDCAREIRRSRCIKEHPCGNCSMIYSFVVKILVIPKCQILESIQVNRFKPHQRKPQIIYYSSSSLIDKPISKWMCLSPSETGYAISNDGAMNMSGKFWLIWFGFLWAHFFSFLGHSCINLWVGESGDRVRCKRFILLENCLEFSMMIVGNCQPLANDSVRLLQLKDIVVLLCFTLNNIYQFRRKLKIDRRTSHETFDHKTSSCLHIKETGGM